MARRGFRGSFAPRRQGPRRASDWAASADDTGITALAASAAVLDQTLAASQLLGGAGTIVRTRGSIWVSTDQTANTEAPFGAIGFAVVTDQAAAIGVTAVPTPITDEVSDQFFVYESFLSGILVSSDISIMNPWMEYKFDSKAMRKVEASQTIIVTVENASSSAGLQYVVKFRMLIKQT